MISLEDRAADLYDLVRNCELCPLSQTRTLAVPGEGPLDAEVMCIGEAPGMNEDKQGRPFVGAAGQFLSELLGAAGLRREDVYICNVLKCRPPGNRDPLPDEIEACSEYLDLQLDMVDPLVVVTLGRFSMSKWFPQQAISRIHGSVKEADGRLIVPMYHPAAALHQGNLRKVLLEDFAKLPAVVERARRMRRAASQPEFAQEPAPPPVNAPATPPGTVIRPNPAGRTEPEPPWEETPPGSLEDVEFDPGDVAPAMRAAVAPASEPPPPGQLAAASAEEHADSSAEPPAPPQPAAQKDTTAGQHADPAAKSAQLSLFD